MGEVLIEGRRLDVKEGLDFSFNYSIADVRDPNKRSTEYSKTIQCPSTPGNDELFGNIWDVNISNPYNSTDLNVEVNFNPNKKAEARVVADGVEVMVGVVQLRSITIVSGKMDYEVVFIGKLKNIFSALGDSQLNDVDDSGLPLIDFSNLDHELQETVIQASWNNTTGYTYPLIDYGQSFDYDSQGKRIYDVEDFRPAVFLKDVVDKIFDYTGFTYTSSFFNASPFVNLVVPWFKESFTLTDTQIADRQFTAESTIDYDFWAETPTVETINSVDYNIFRLEFDDLNDPNNLWNDTLYEYSPSDIGYYQMYVDLNLTFTRIATGGSVGVLPCTIVVKRLSNAVESIVDTIAVDIQLPSGGIGSTETTNISWSSGQELMFVGDTIWFEVFFEKTQFDLVDSLAEFDFDLDSGSTAFNQVSEQQIFEGSNVYMNNFVPDIGMSDLLLSVFKMFNLYVTVDKTDETNLLIETRDDYYAGGTTRDWNKKLARDKKITIKPLGSLTAKEYIYTYNEDEDYYNSRYQDSRGYTYGRRRVDTDNDFLTNTRKVEIDFAPTPLVNDDVTSRIIPKIYDEDIEEGAKPVDIEARVLYFNPFRTSNPKWIFRYNGGNDSDEWGTYPYAGHLNDPISPTLDLNFGIPNELFYSANGYTGTLQYTNANLFNVYHRAYLDEITNKDSKVFTGEFYLTPWDIDKLDFRDQIIVDNSYWRINKVNDYNPFKDGLTKVELIKVLDVIKQPAEVFTLGSQGSNNGEKYPTNKHSAKLNRNQFQSFKGSVKGKRNNVNDGATSYKIIGDDNFIAGGSKNITILGNNNEVFNGASNVVIINSDNQKVTADNTTIIDGKLQWRYVDVKTTYTATDREFVLADATSAGFTVTLPSLEANIWVAIKKTDSTGNAVTIATVGSETIDGALTLTLPSQYDSVDLYCNGKNWFIR